MRRKGINERSGNQSKTKKNDRFRLENGHFLMKSGNLLSSRTLDGQVLSP